MAECVLMKNGGGVQSDDTTATADKIALGFTYLGADTDGDVGIGTSNAYELVNVGFYQGDKSNLSKRQTFSIKNVKGWENLTSADILVRPNTGYFSCNTGNCQGGYTGRVRGSGLGWSYANGIVTVTGGAQIHEYRDGDYKYYESASFTQGADIYVRQYIKYL